MKLNPEELEEMIEPVEKTDLIYGYRRPSSF